MLRSIIRHSIFLVVLISASVIARAQVSISGPTCVVAGGTAGYQYTLSGSFNQNTSIQWCVTGGIIVQNGQTCRTGTFGSIGASVRIVWTPGQSTYRVNAVTGRGNAQRNVTVVSIAQTATPASQNVAYNGSFTITGGGPSSTACTPTYTYSWEYATAAAGPFTALTGNTKDYTSTATFIGTRYYRRRTNFNSTDVLYTPIVSVTIQSLQPGSLSVPSTSVNYNTRPAISSTAASGGACTTVTYQWQQSVENGPWTNIGTTESYPASAPLIKKNTRIRRAVTCGAETLYTNILDLTMVYVSPNAENRNYVRTNDIWVRNVQNWIEADQLPIGDKQQSTTYFDGLGRPLQTVGMKASPQQYDLVTPAFWDESGREPYKYLPYRASSQDGKFKATAVADQQAFLTSGPSPFYPGETKPYTEVQFEQSPLNRVLATYAPGNLWGGAGRGVLADYQVNEAAEDVRIWTIADAQGSIPTSPGAYAAGDLLKTTSVNEDGNKVVEYSDKSGRIILRKVQLSVTPSVDHDGWLCTYYVYDFVSNLRFVIPPKGVVDMTTNLRSGYVRWQMHPDVANLLCYRYEFDLRGRMIIKKIPGANEIHMVYDVKDRLVLLQDGNLRSPNKWNYTIYDDLGRPLSTGLWTSTLTRAGHQLAADQSATYPTLTTGDPNIEELTRTFYDNYEWAASVSMNTTLEPANINASNFITNYGTAPYYAEEIKASQELRGMTTGVMVKVLGTTTNLYTITLFDDRMRPVQIKSQNFTGATDVSTLQYDFSGKQLRSHISHVKAGVNSQAHQILTKNTYDHSGRLLKVSQNLDNLQEKQISTMAFDELGQMKRKELGRDPENSAIPLESQDYEYNIRGWMSAINKQYTEGQGAVTSNYYGQILNYGAGGYQGEAYYAGNISAWKWKSKGDAIQRQYQYSYDKADRLIHAEFSQRNYSGSSYATSWTKDKIDYTVSNLTYDANGNIMSMKQMGVKVNTPQVIDDLTYFYITNSNRLAKVNDGILGDNKLGDFTDGTNQFSTEYSFDFNGNTTLDRNNGGFLKNIFYNHLNLPKQVNITGKGTVEYIYDASGVKHLKKVTDNTISPSKVSTTNYIGAFVYENDILQFVIHQEGRFRVKPNGSSGYTLVSDYFVKDHLGSVREILTDEQLQDVYPAATLEEPVESLNQEKNFYNITDGQIVNSSTVPELPVYQNNNGNPPFNTNPLVNTTANSVKLYRLNGVSEKTGLGITLKVMSGDKVDIFLKSYYYLGNGDIAPGNNPVDLNNLLADFVGGFFFRSTGKSVPLTVLQNDANITGQLSSFLSSQQAGSSTVPKAYLNWILFDEQFNPIINSFNSNSGSDPVSSQAGQIKEHFKTTGEILRNGYLYVYVSNESPVNVYFDNLQVVHTRGRLLEENNYYPYGLSMAALSSKSMQVSPTNRIKFSGKEEQRFEFTDGSGIEVCDFGGRYYDQQIGRWTTIDPLVSNYYWLTPYNYCNNNPIKFIDPNGLAFKDTLNGRYDVAVLETIVIRPKKKSSLANRAFPWVKSIYTKESRLWMDRKSTYVQARFQDVGESDAASLLGDDVSARDLLSFERAYKAEVAYRNSQIIFVSALAAPLVAAYAPGVFMGPLELRAGSALSDFVVQYQINLCKYRTFGDAFMNINISSTLGNFFIPGSALGSAVVGNGFQLKINGEYSGFSATSRSSTVLSNILIGFGGNLLGDKFRGSSVYFTDILLAGYAGNLPAGVVQELKDNISGQK